VERSSMREGQLQFGLVMASDVLSMMMLSPIFDSFDYRTLKRVESQVLVLKIMGWSSVKCVC
jgi:hypothetical protein